MLQKLYWFWIPVVFLLFQVMIEIILPGTILEISHTENGPHELLQFVVILIAFLYASYILFRMKKANNYGHVLWVFIACICCLYVTVEEVSWGQHFFEWSTPEYWQHVNDQQETNLHNTSSWLDQKPRLMLELGVVVGGLIIPFLLRAKSRLLPLRFNAIYPTQQLSVVAGIFLLLKVIDQVEKFTFQMFTRISEVQELYLFYFVLLYLFIIKDRFVDAK